MTVTILSVLVLLLGLGLVSPDVSRLGLWDAACEANGANGDLDVQGVVDGAPPCLGVLRFDVDVVPSYLTLPDVDVNLVLLHVLWDVCHGDVLVDGSLCLKLS